MPAYFPVVNVALGVFLVPLDLENDQANIIPNKNLGTKARHLASPSTEA